MQTEKSLSWRLADLLKRMVCLEFPLRMGRLPVCAHSKSLQWNPHNVDAFGTKTKCPDYTRCPDFRDCTSVIMWSNPLSILGIHFGDRNVGSRLVSPHVSRTVRLSGGLVCISALTLAYPVPYVPDRNSVVAQLQVFF